MGQPHGYGEKCYTDLETNQFVEYTGLWQHGKEHGKGVVRDDDTGQIIFDGFWRKGKREGFGRQVFDEEEFEGNFLSGKRHGFGTLQSRKGKLEGQVFQGFWRDGFQDGIGRRTFPSRCRALNTKKPDSLVEFGKINCLTIYERGSLIGEFNFMKQDGTLISLEESKSLTNGACKRRNKTIKDVLATTAIWKECDVCWVCCKTAQSPMVICQGCGFTTHTSHKNVERCPFPSCDGTEGTLKGHCISTKGEAFTHIFNLLSKPSNGSIMPQRKKPVPNRKTVALPSIPQEQKEGISIAKRMGTEFCRKRTALQAGFLKAQLMGQRREEMARRKSWSAQIMAKQSLLTALESDLLLSQNELSTKQLQLNRFHGRDLNSMGISDITVLQTQVEDILEKCRQAIESHT
eukprot:CAMPEP_0203761186 /NCGR_PEP_ID=MMETSP0098-20131031/14327_1 /ASSEMBLY_ACC=CAM_ASM_000208 /TAXON_ID=96639 /ORGANISM=" , Strain NY0313808BC1" /LENGTH=403 /DNA_ID=CAMNT_0050655073 /DNA_START=60 /DNA_END=1271 /DNA_ORIENTATION=-